LDLGAQLGELGVGGAAVELVHDLHGCVRGPVPSVPMIRRL
jgi:hypothetical protein